MDPVRKRKIRLVTALSAALLLAGALAFTSFSASSPTKTPSELLALATPGERTYQLTGKVVDGSVTKSGNSMSFRVRDREGTTAVPVTYSGAVPDPFKDGREVIVRVKRQGDVFVGERDSLVTKCPSKFTEDKTKAT